MNAKPISPKAHGLIDYALTAGLLVVPTIFGFSKEVKRLYTIQALVLLGYIAITDHPSALKKIIPFRVHGKIDPVNVSIFTLQTFLKPFLKDKKARAFNIGFTILTAALVALTKFDNKPGSEKM